MIAGEPASPLSVRLFGPFGVLLSGRPLSRLSLRKSPALLALLVLRQGGEVERDWLAGLLWPDSAQASALHSLRNCLTELRRALGPEAARLRSPTFRTIALDLLDAAVDVLAFDVAIARGDPLSLAEAVALYRGPLLEGWAEEWAFQERQAREQAYLTALERLAALALASEDKAAGEGYLRRAVAVDPLRESTQRALMAMLAAGGSYASALLCYRELRLRLHRELNAEPDPETQALFEQLRAEARDKASASRLARSRRHPSSSRTIAGADDGSNGRSALISEDQAAVLEGHDEERGPAAGSRPFQRHVRDESLPAREERRQAIQQAAGVRPSLPLQLTRFFGREAEIERLCAWLRGDLTAASGGHPTPVSLSCLPTSPLPRLVTLTGPGGSGKTRLALEVAHALRAAFAGAVCFVALADVADPHLIADRIREALGLPRTSESGALEQVVAFLSHRAAGGNSAAEDGQPWLLLLDNFEQLLSASPEPGTPPARDGAAVVWALLQRVETLRVLVTSRQRLALPGEQELPVAPLPVPVESRKLRVESPVKANPSDLSTLNSQLSTLTQCPSVALFLDRAQAVQADFQLNPGNEAAVARLCRGLEGLPLAVVLAAARVRVLTPAEMLVRLEQRFELLVGQQRAGDPRHRSLRAALDWSYQLLSPELQRFFVQLSVFRGGWTLEAAEQVCEQPRALDFLEELQQCSMVVTAAVGEETRYRLLESLREYGAERLSTDEQTGLAQRHMAYYAARIERIGRDPDRVWRQFLNEMEREHDNLRAALDWMVRSGPALEWMLKSGDNLGWDFLGLLSCLWQHTYQTEGRRWLARIMRLPTGSVPGPLWGWVHAMAADLARLQGDFAAAPPLIQASQAIFQELGHKAGERWCCYLLALLAQCQGDYARARAFYEKLGAMAREGEKESVTYRIGYTPRLAAGAAQYGMGCATYLEGDLGTAQALLEQGLRILRDRGDEEMGYIAFACAHLGEIADARGDYTVAQARLEEVLVTMGDFPWGIAYVRHKLGRVAQHQGQWDAAADHFAESLSVWRQIGNKQGITECFEGVGAVAAGQGQPERAARFLGAAAALRESRGVPIPPVEHADLDRVVAAVRAGLGEEAFAAAWAVGQSSPVGQAIAEALGEAPGG